MTKPNNDGIKPTTVQDEFKPFPKSKDNGNSHPRSRVGKTKKDKAKEVGNSVK